MFIITSSRLHRHRQKLSSLTLAASEFCCAASSSRNIRSRSYSLKSTSTQQSRSDDTGDNFQHNGFYGGSNFQQMLQYQKIASQTSRPQKSSTNPKNKDQLTHVHKQTQSIRHRQHSKNNRMRPRQTTSKKLDNQREDVTDKMAEVASSKETAAKKNAESSSRVASSNWLLVSNIPPMSKLSDVVSGIEKIISFEMNKGVIDLDKIEDYLSVNLKQRRGNLDKLGAQESFYATEEIDASSGIPLWAPELDDEELPSHMVLEARLHLSQHARPKGWFLRLPSRSIVHAVLNHNKEAERLKKIEIEQVKLEEKAIKGERRKWRQGLWKGVWSEHENALVSSENKKLLNNEKEEDWNLAFGVESDERLNVCEVNAASAEDITVAEVDEVPRVEDENGEEMLLEEDPHAIAFAYLDEYAQTNPYPEPLKAGPEAASPGYHPLTCGSTQLKVEEFHPESHYNRLRSWEQASFQLSPVLNLSDSVVRIETKSLDKSVDDIQYLFRGYDLESILPEKIFSNSALPPACADYAKSLGWNTKGEGSNIDILIDGRARSVNPRHTFLVRFASASSARMAVRDELRFRQGDDMLTMTQFPKSMF